MDGRLVKRGASQFVAGPADPALYFVGLAGLIVSRREAEMGANVA
jgi:hypothetical protein